MNEKQWVGLVIKLISPQLKKYDSRLKIAQGMKLPYAYEIQSYSSSTDNLSELTTYETDILVFEQVSEELWKPRLIIEAKINSITSHAAITYSQKALSHKQVQPYLRYGIILGNREHHPLPGRLYRHGAYFDFMMSWVAFEPQESELDDLFELIISEVNASRKLEEILYSSRKSDRERYTILHRPLILK